MSGNPYAEVWYEDLFSDRVTFAQRLTRVNDILEFLGVSGIDAKDSATVSRVRALFDPAASRMNSETTYLRIPGILDIESRFGSDRTGWLFRESLDRA